jgi:transcriptional regulator with XRE-family HTH domain
MDSKKRYGAFGAEIEQRRTACGMTVEELAERAELSPTFLKELESGEQYPSLASIMGLAQAFNVAPRDLLANIPKGPTLESAVVQALKAVPSDVLRSFLKTTEQAKEETPPIEPPQTDDP